MVYMSMLYDNIRESNKSDLYNGNMVVYCMIVITCFMVSLSLFTVTDVMHVEHALHVT